MSDPVDLPDPGPARRRRVGQPQSASPSEPASAQARAKEADEPEREEAEEEDDDALEFSPVQQRFRHDGWTHERQEDFIRALAESGCVIEAARRVGMSTTSAYKLRALPEADSFRFAWDAAIDMAMPRMSDAAISRCIYGVPVPHFYKGEQVGEHRRYDERLTMWLLRYRDPVRYGKWLDRVSYRRAPDGAATTLMHRLFELWEDAFGFLKRRRSPVGPVGPDEDTPR